LLLSLLKPCPIKRLVFKATFLKKVPVCVAAKNQHNLRITNLPKPDKNALDKLTNPGNARCFSIDSAASSRCPIEDLTLAAILSLLRRDPNFKPMLSLPL